jgi:hypothetical protein
MRVMRWAIVVDVVELEGILIRGLGDGEAGGEKT